MQSAILIQQVGKEQIYNVQKNDIRVSEARTADRLQMSCEHVSLELRPKTSKTVSSAYR